MRNGDEPFCYTCISSAWWQECEACDGDGIVEVEDWEIGDDFVRCDCCDGKGGWWNCFGHEQHDLDPGSIHRIPLEEREVVK